MSSNNGELRKRPRAKETEKRKLKHNNSVDEDEENRPGSPPPEGYDNDNNDGYEIEQEPHNECQNGSCHCMSGPPPLFHLTPLPQFPIVTETAQDTVAADNLIAGSLGRQQDLEWGVVNEEDADEPHNDSEAIDEDEVEPASVETFPDTYRVLRSAAIAAAASLSCDSSAQMTSDNSTLVDHPVHPVLDCAKVNLTDAVDDEHRQLLNAYNESVENLARLRSYLAKHPDQDCKSLYLHLCEEAVILQSEAEMRYLRTCDAYQAIDSGSQLRHAYVHKSIPPAVVKNHRSKVIKGKTVVMGRDENGKWPMSELVGEWIKAAKKEEKDQIFPDDAKGPLFGDGDLQPGQSTLSDFLRDLEAVCALKNIPHNGKLSILDWLRRHVPELRTGTRVSKAGNNVHDFYKYLITDWRHVLIDACPNNCILYVGDHRWDIKCPCGEYRFSKCGNNGNCTQGGIDCDPFKTPTHNQRSSYQVVMYRPLIIKLFWMYKNSLDGFNPFAYQTSRVHLPGHMSDIVDSPVFQDHTSDMHDNFQAFKRTYEGTAELMEFSLCLSIFYDGDKLYKRSNDSLWPLLVSVLNCDPSYRTKLGLGIFSVALHNLPVGSPAEQSIIDDLLTEELKQLENGILFEFQRPNGAHAVFVQARALCWNVDTRAYEKVFHSPLSPSLFGCSRCGKCHGLSRKITGAPAYIGSTLFLPDDHALRHMGRRDMPDGYFGDHGEERNRQLGKEITATALATSIRGDADADEEAAAEAEDNAVDQNDGILPRDPTSIRGPHPSVLPKRYSWVSEKFPYSMFAEAIDSAVTDTRPQEQMTLVGHEEYVDNAKEALLFDLADFFRTGRFLKRDYVVNGIHKVLSAWVVLKAPLFHESPFDLMHCLANIVAYIMEWVIGTRACDTKTRKLCVAQKRLLFLRTRGVVPGWRAGLYSRQWADSVHRCMNIPSWYKRDFQFDLPLKYSGEMNSHQKGMFMTAFCEYFFSFCDLSKPYYALFCRFAYDVRRALNPYVKVGVSLSQQVLHVAETLALFSAMLPDSQQPFVLHQFLEIINGMQVTGPVKSTSCFTGERVMGAVGQGVTDGGQKYIISVMKRLVAKENAFDQNFEAYKTNKMPFVDNKGNHSNMVLKLTGRMTPITLNLEIKSRLFNDMQEFLTTQLIDCLVVKSPFARLFYTFEATYARWKKGRAGEQRRPFPSTFAAWIHELYAIYMESDTSDFNAQKVEHLVSDVLYCVLDTANVVAYLTPVEMDKYCADLMQDTISLGKVYIADFHTTIKELAEFGVTGKQSVASYIHGIVKGVKLTGRGEPCAEDTVVEVNNGGTNRVGLYREFEVQKAVNILKDNWHPHFQVNSWCRVTDFYVNNTKRVVPRLYFGQINYLFRMFVPSDEILHGCAFANLTLRKVVEDPRRGNHSYVGMNDAHTYVADKHFVSLNYVDSTAVALSALDEDSLPVMNPSQVRKNMKFAPKDYKLHFSKKRSDELDRLYFIELHKERLFTEYYSTIEDDLQNTKVFEEQILTHHAECGRFL